MSDPRLGVASALLLLTLWLVIGTVGFVVIEGWAFFDALYMTIITLSTVGYNEVHGLSAAGKAFASFIIVAGLGTVFYAFTRLGQLVIEGELLDLLGRRRMESDIQNLSDHYIVCGYGRTAEPVVEGLAEADRPFCIIEIDEGREPELIERGFLYVAGDALDEHVLQKAGIERAKGLLALLPSDADNLYLTMTVKGINPSIEVIARATEEEAESKLRRGGADRVVSLYKIAGLRVLHAAIRPTVLEFMELATHREHLHLSMEQVQVGEGSVLHDRSLAEAQLRQQCGVIVVAIKRQDGEMVFNPPADERIHVGDTLVAMGEEENLTALDQLAG